MHKRKSFVETISQGESQSDERILTKCFIIMTLQLYQSLSFEIPRGENTNLFATKTRCSNKHNYQTNNKVFFSRNLVFLVKQHFQLSIFNFAFSLHFRFVHTQTVHKTINVLSAVQLTSCVFFFLLLLCSARSSYRTVPTSSKKNICKITQRNQLSETC